MKHRFALPIALILLLGLGTVTPGVGQEAPQADEKTPLATGASQVLEQQMSEHPNRRIPRTLREEALCVGVFQETLARYAAGSDETAQVADSLSTR